MIQKLYLSPEKEIPSVTVGEYTYTNENNVFEAPQRYNHILIGRFCSISYNVTYIVGRNHDYHKLSTFPMHGGGMRKLCEKFAPPPPQCQVLF